MAPLVTVQDDEAGTGAPVRSMAVTAGRVASPGVTSARRCHPLVGGMSPPNSSGAMLTPTWAESLE
jgi:hypothetical protein